MNELIIDCGTGEATTRDLTADEATDVLASKTIDFTLEIKSKASALQTAIDNDDIKEALQLLAAGTKLIK